jgi:hypothetical protein
MKRIFVVNGDADGLCSLQQLVLAEGAWSELVTGPKRRTALLQQVSGAPDAQVTVLDLSLDTNRVAAERLLAAGTRLRYFDHHHAGAKLEHPLFESHIDPSPATCTSDIVNRFLGGAHAAWAATGAFGDNLRETARGIAAQAGIGDEEAAQLERLGMLLNYNAYGDDESDLFFPPAELHAKLAAYRHPLEFVQRDPAFGVLAEGHDDDMRRAAELPAHAEEAHAAIYLLPDEPWARRVSGVLANRLARTAPQRAHAVLTHNSGGGLQVSVRAPLARPSGAARLCREFATGGGREGAAGINHLPAGELGRFSRRFFDEFE